MKNSNAPEATAETTMPDTATSTATMADSASAKADDDQPNKVRSYFVAADGRSTGSLRKKNDEIKMTPNQAKFLILGNQVFETKEAIKEFDAKVEKAASDRQAKEKKAAE